MFRARWTSLGLAAALLWPAAASTRTPRSATGEAARGSFTVVETVAPRVMTAKARRHARLRLRNDGAASWTVGDYQVAARWRDRSDELLAKPLSPHWPLPADVPQGDVVEIGGRLVAPDRPGIYRLQWKVQQVGGAWLSSFDPGPPTLRTVVVLPSLASCLWIGMLATALWMAVPRRRRTETAAERSGDQRPRGSALPPALRFGPGLRLILLAAVSVLLASVAGQDRSAPTVFGDEMLYAFKARNFATHGNYYAPDVPTDNLHHSPPLYSLLLAPIYLVTSDPEVAFRAILLLNALLHASMVYPAYKIAEAEFPGKKWVVAMAAAVWTIPAGYSLSIMSEALYVPLFLWTGFFYLRMTERPGVGRASVVGLAATLLLFTRFSGVAMLGVLGLLALFAHEQGRLRLARGREALARLPMVVVPAAGWLLLGWFREVHGSGPTRTAWHFVVKGTFKLETGAAQPLDFFKAWWGQLVYLNFATFNLLVLLLVLAAAAYAVGPARSRGGDRNSLFSLRVYFVLACAAMITVSAVYMFLHVGTGKPRYLMNGRYADMVVPIVVVYALGMLEGRPALERSWRWAAVGSLGLLANFLLYRFVPPVASTHIINMGAAWYEDLQRMRGAHWLAVGGLTSCLLILLLVRRRRRVRAVFLAVALAALNLHNTGLVAASLTDLQIQDASHWRALREVRASGGRVLDAGKPGSIRLFFLARYYLYDRVMGYSEGQPADPDRDYVVTADGFVPVRRYLDRDQTAGGTGR